jgi:RHS repeat-associated protein
VVESSILGGHEAFTVDALGNRKESQTPPSIPEYYVYQAGSGRLARSHTYTSNTMDTTFYSYEWDGALGETNRYHYWSYPWSFVYDWARRTTLSTYNAERQVTRSVFVLDSAFNNPPPAPQFPPGYQSYQSEETYRYDALGRRIYTRGIRGPNCQNKDQISGCRSTLTRTVWDGDQILFEIRVPGDSSYPQLESDAPGGTIHWGVVGYLHSGGMDQPLALWKNTQLVQPHANWRGAFVKRTCPADPCGTAVWFPGATAAVFGEPSPLAPSGPPSWHGSLLESGQDASGYQYRRNRYYDPKTGRFTQEDPIGLAGGLNLYSFAGGDPVNFSDPFGLCPPCGVGDNPTLVVAIIWADPTLRVLLV